MADTTFTSFTPHLASSSGAVDPLEDSNVVAKEQRSNNNNNKKRKQEHVLDSVVVDGAVVVVADGDGVGGVTNNETETAPSPSATATDLKQQQPPEQQQQQRPLTQDGERPQKRFYRQRAHCNPLSHNDSFAYPVRPRDMDWTVPQHYPKYATTTTTTSADDDETGGGGGGGDACDKLRLQPTVLDVGCGFGGLTMALGEIVLSSSPSPISSSTTTLVLGLEIRAKVAEYVRLRIASARTNSNSHHNVSVLRTNSQKFLVHYFEKHSMDKLFFCFPDPHFKRKNHPRRIISDRLLAEYAYVLKPGTGKLYCITDVLELHEWHVQKCNAHPLLELVSEQENALDPCVAAMINKTEEGQKVERNKGSKYHAVYRRISKEQEEALQTTSANFFGVAAVAATTQSATA